MAIETRLVGDLCETYSTENKKLLQAETNLLYGSSCIDVVAGYYTDGKPYSRYTYIETDQLDIEEEPAEETQPDEEVVPELGNIPETDDENPL